MLEGFYLAVAVGLLGLSILVIFRAPVLPLVFLAVGATELGHWFALFSMGVALVASSSITKILALVAAALLATPCLRAAWSAPWLGRTLAAGFGGQRVTFRWRELFRWPGHHRGGGERLVIEGPGGPLGVDFYRAKTGEPAPLVVVAHGGGWLAGESREFAGWNRWLAARGYAVASVDYRLVPTGAWPAQRDDVLAAIDHLRGHASRFGIDPERIVLFGRSAGGQIVSAIAAPGGLAWLRGCVCLYAPFDLDFAYAHGSDDDVLRSRWLLRCYLGGPPGEAPAHYREASAYLTATEKAPPFLLLHGAPDELVWIVQGERFAARLNALGVRNVLLRLPWARHAFDYNLHGPGGQALAASLASFLEFTCDSNVP